jgi:rubrerythrin
MVTMVGMQHDFISALKDLLELEYDTVEAYEAALNRLERADYKKTMSDFLKDHQRHIKEISGLLEHHGHQAPKGPSTGKQWLTKGKVILANLVGDKTILVAMASNEVDTNTAYERMMKFEEKLEDSEDILKRALEDERRHKAWLESITPLSE